MTLDERLDAVGLWHCAVASCDVEMILAHYWPAWIALWAFVGEQAIVECLIAEFTEG